MNDETEKLERPAWEPRFRRHKAGVVNTWLLARGFAVVVCERFLASFWPFLTAMAGGVALAASGWPSSLPAWMHIALLATGAVLLAWAGFLGVRTFRFPGRDALLRHLELANRLEHRPLAALEDQIAFGDGDRAIKALWMLHRRQAIDAVQGVGAGSARPRLARRDPFALRIAVLLALFAVAGLNGDRVFPNILDSLNPRFAPRTDLAALTLDAWITPPEYTSVAPVFLSLRPSPDSAPEQVQVPAGSVLVTQIGGAGVAPQLTLEETTEPFEANGPGSHRIEKLLGVNADVTVSIDEENIAAWRIAIVPDLPPTAELAERPYGLTVRRSLELDYKATDDYGVSSLSIEIRKTADPIAAGDKFISVEIASPDAGERDVTGATFVNLLQHIWAGEPVFAQLRSEDAIGQITLSAPLAFILPAREFSHPVAKALIEQRRKLARERQAVATDVANDIRALGQAKDIYRGDVVVYMGLSLIYRRLGGEKDEAPTDRTVDRMVDLLWDLALRLEDGDLSVAERRLREAERALAEAIERGADPAEIERLMDALQQAMNDYLRAMAQDALKRLEQGELAQNPLDEDAQTLAQSDIDQIMDRIRELLRQGQNDAAQRLLQQLQRMMENMQAGISSQPSPEALEAMEMLESLQQLMQGQQELLDRTFSDARNSQFMEGQGQEGQKNRRGQLPGSVQPSSGPRGADAALQEALRQQLGDIRRRFEEMTGSSPQSFGQADREMRRSTDALRQDAPGDAVGPQGQAIEQMRSAARAAQQAFMERFGNQMGQGQQARGRGSNNPPDPFNRSAGQMGLGNENDGSDVKIPGTGALKRAREIRDELRRRASDRKRPETELQYLDRLLNPFE